MQNSTQENKSGNKLKVKITGHLKGNYSLAIVNRDFALALDKYTVQIEIFLKTRFFKRYSI